MTIGLPISDVINVQVLLSPQAAQQRNFGNLLILGDSDVIDTFERYRTYTGSSQIAADFGIASPEYDAAQLYFGQSPQPQLCYVGRWASTATHGIMRGGIMGPTQQALTNFTGIANGSISIPVDGQPHVITNLNLTGVLNLNGLAAILQTALLGIATVVWDSNNNRFIVESSSTGSLSTVGYAAPPGSGTDLGPLLQLTLPGGAYAVPGIVAETITAAVTLFNDKSTDWYGLMIASNAVPVDADIVSVAAFIESASPSHTFGATTLNPATLDPSISADLASLLKIGGYRRTFSQYSSSEEMAVASIFGRAFTVDFSGQNTTITLAFKQEPSVPPELITESQKAALFGKNCNVFLKYNNNTTILQQGNMASGDWFDAIHGTDWLQNQVQTNIWNLFLTTGTKIPQTDDGLNQVITAVVQALQQGVNNGLLFAGGVWTGPPIGTVLKTGDTLPAGYLVFAPKVSTQSQADRAARKTPLIQAAVKLAGAFHSANVLISVNQ